MSSKFFLSTFLSIFFIAGCASAPKSNPQSSAKLTQVELECQSSCRVMAKCGARAGVPYSEHDLVTCNLQCAASNPIIRTAVAQCSVEVLSKDCDAAKMHLCVRSKVMSLRQ